MRGYEKRHPRTLLAYPVEILLGYDFGVGLNPDFVALREMAGLADLWTLDSNIVLREPEPQISETGAPWPFFETLDGLLSFTARHDITAATMLAVSWVHVFENEHCVERWCTGNPKSYDLRTTQTEHLGLDVCDGFLLSGLLNMGNSSQVEKYRDFLNINGLFADYASARSFALECDAEVPEHRPFYVFSLARLTTLHCTSDY